MHKWDGPQCFPQVITIFSAPNYCGYYDNKAAVLIIDEGSLSIKQYDESEVPYRLPDNMDIFSWSLPFVVEKVINMMLTIVKKVGEQPDSDGGDDEVDEMQVDAVALINKQAQNNIKKRRDMFKAKLMGFAKMAQMFQVLTSERENILKIKNVSPDGKIPRGLLRLGKKAIQSHVR